MLREMNISLAMIHSQCHNTIKLNIQIKVMTIINAIVTCLLSLTG